MGADEITPQSVYQSLSAVRAQMEQQQLLEQRRQMLLQSQMQPEPQAQQAAMPQAQPQESPYLGDNWIAQQKRIQDAKQYSYGKMAQANLSQDQHKQIKEYVDSKYDPTGEFSKPFRESPLYKQAQAAANEKDTTSQRQTIDLLKNSVDSIEKIGSPDDTREDINRKKAAQIKTFLTSLVNSAKGSSDAEQANEVLRRSTEIFSLPEMQALRNKGVLDATGIMSYLSSKEGNGVIEKLAKSFEADPDSYLQKVKVIHDDLASSWNKRMEERVVYPTNPQIAKEFGIVPRPLFGAAQEAQDIQVIRPQAQPSQQAQQQYTPDQIKAARAALQALRAAKQAQRPAQQAAAPVDYTGKEGF